MNKRSHLPSWLQIPHKGSFLNPFGEVENLLSPPISCHTFKALNGGEGLWLLIKLQNAFVTGKLLNLCGTLDMKQIQG